MESAVIVAELGSGGMADVFLAMRRGLGGFVKLVVIKRLRTSTIEADAVAMFHDEARISARLNHPNVVQTHEAGFDGEHYRLEMEYLDGQPLHRIAHRAKKAGRAIPQAVAVAVVRDVLAGLHYAHELCDYDGSSLGIVHRDVSPQNIFVTYDGRVKLVDFGIAKASGQLSVTQLGMVKGKIRYMAPEQATGRPVDVRADVFAAGIVLWQLLAGRSYWGDADELGIYERIRRGDLPESPRSANPDIPEGLDRVCARALAVDPSARYGTAQELHDALEPWAPADARGGVTMGRLAADLFTDMREKVRAEIEKAAARPAGVAEEDLAQLALSSSSTERLAVPSDRPVSQNVTLGERPRRFPLSWVAAATVVLAGACAVSIFLSASQEPRSVVTRQSVSGNGLVAPPPVPAAIPQSTPAAPLLPLREDPGTTAPEAPATGTARRGATPSIPVAARVSSAGARVAAPPQVVGTSEPRASDAVVDAGAPARRAAGPTFSIVNEGDPWDAAARPAGHAPP